jgi:hypothetical protein
LDCRVVATQLATISLAKSSDAAFTTVLAPTPFYLSAKREPSMA